MFDSTSRQLPGDLGGVGEFAPGRLRQMGHDHAAKKIEPERYLGQMQKQALKQCQERDGAWGILDERLKNQWANQRQAVYDGFVRLGAAEARLSGTAGAFERHYGVQAPAEVPRIHGRMYYLVLAILALVEAPINFVAFQPLSEQNMIAAIILAILVTGGVMVSAHVVGIYLHRMKLSFSRIVVYATTTCVFLMVLVVAFLRYSYFAQESASFSGVTLPPIVVATLFFVLNMIFFGAGLLLSHALHEPLMVAHIAALRAFNNSVSLYESAVVGTNSAFATRMEAWQSYRKGIQQVQADYLNACGQFCTAYGEIPDHYDVPAENDWPIVQFDTTEKLIWPMTTGQEREDEQQAFISRFPLQGDTVRVASDTEASPVEDSEQSSRQPSDRSPDSTLSESRAEAPRQVPELQPAVTQVDTQQGDVSSSDSTAGSVDAADAVHPLVTSKSVAAEEFGSVPTASRNDRAGVARSDLSE